MRTKTVIKKIKNRIKSNPVRTIRGIAKSMELAPTTVHRVVHEDLGMKSRARRKKHLINNNTKAKRLERSQRILNKLKSGGLPPVVFSDEKLFRVDRVSNSRTDRYISSEHVRDVPDNVKFTFKTKHAASVMVLGVVSSDGKKCPPIFIRNNEKVNSDMYISLLEKKVKPWLDKEYPDGAFIFQQDGAPCHTSQKTQEWCRSNLSNFWPKDVWPPSSPDLSPLDFNI